MAGVERLQARQLFSIRFDQIGQLQQNAAPVGGGHAAPRRKGLLRRSFVGRGDRVGVVAAGDVLELGALPEVGDEPGGARRRVPGRHRRALLDGLGLAALVRDVDVELAGAHR